MCVRWLGVIALASAWLAVGPASAGGPVERGQFHAPAGGWELRATPYAWLTNLNGETAIRGRDVAVDVTFLELIEQSDTLVALYGRGEARNGRFSVLKDAVFARLTVSESEITTLNPVRNVTLSERADLGLEFQLLILEGAAAYELFARHRGGGCAKDLAPTSTTALDVIAGARYWNLQADLTLDIVDEIDIPAFGIRREGSRAIADGGTVEWVDPLIGLRLRHEFADGGELFVRADFGGFGAGSAFSWNAIAGYSWECECRPFGATMRGVIGYRALYADYSEGSGHHRFEWDMTIFGPIIGTSFVF